MNFKPNKKIFFYKNKDFCNNNNYNKKANYNKYNYLNNKCNLICYNKIKKLILTQLFNKFQNNRMIKKRLL